MTTEIKRPPRLVALDTEVFYKFNSNYDSTACRNLIKFVREERIRLLLTSVNLHEVKGHIKEKAQSISLSINKFLKDLNQYDFKPSEHSIKSQVPSNGSLLNTFKKKVNDIAPSCEKIYQELLNPFEAFLKEAKFEVIEINRVSTDKVFENYFSCIPPFRTGKKKSGFPDAFALLALQKKAEDKEKMIYIVSGDSNWKFFCTLTENTDLVYFEDVYKLLDKINEDINEDNDSDDFGKCYELYEDKKDEIKEEIRKNFPGLKFSLYLDDSAIKWGSEKIEVLVNSVDIIYCSLININDLDDFDVNQLLVTFELVANIHYDANITYISLENEFYDREEGRYGGSEQINIIIPQSCVLEVEVTLAMSRGKDDTLCCPVIKDININPYNFDEIGIDRSFRYRLWINEWDIIQEPLESDSGGFSVCYQFF